MYATLCKSQQNWMWICCTVPWLNCDSSVCNTIAGDVVDQGVLMMALIWIRSRKLYNPMAHVVALHVSRIRLRAYFERSACYVIWQKPKEYTFTNMRHTSLIRHASFLKLRFSISFPYEDVGWMGNIQRGAWSWLEPLYSIGPQKA